MKEEKGIKLDIKPPRAFIVFATDDEVIIQDWTNKIQINYPKKGAIITNKRGNITKKATLIFAQGKMEVKNFKEYDTIKKQTETNDEFKKRITPGLINILLNQKK